MTEPLLKSRELPLVVERAKLLEVADQLKQRVKELEILHSIGKSVTSLLDLDELLTRIVEASVDITGAEEGYVLLVDEGTEELYLRAGQNLGEEHAQGFRLKVHDSIAGSVVKTGKPVIVNSKEERGLKIKTGYIVKSLLNVPLRAREKVIGILGVNNKVSDKAFSEDNLYMLSILADYAAIAIVNARLFSQLSETKERLNGLIASSLDAVIAIDQDRKITVFNRRAEEMFGWTAEEMKGQSVAQLHEDFSKAQEIHEVLDREGTIADWEIVLKHKDGIRILTLLSANLIRDNQGQPIGQAGFLRDLREVKLLEDRLRSFIRVCQGITGTLDLEEVLDLIVESTVAVFPAAQKGSIHLCDEKTGMLHIRASYGYSPEVAKALTLKVGEGRAGWVYKHATPLVVGNVQEDERSRKIDCKIKHPEVQEQKSAICVPLAVGNRVIGTLSLDNVTTFDAFKPEDLGLLSIFSSQAAIAIMNAELMTQNRERLRKLEMLSRASNEIMSNLHSLSLDDRLNLIVRHAAQILDAETSTIFLVKRPGFLSKEASHGHRKGGFHKGREFAIRSGKGTGLIGHIAYTGELFNAHGDDLVGHWATTGRAPDHVASGECCSLLAIPLKRQLGDTKELVGLLDVENKKDTDGQPKSHIGFSKEDEWILSIFAETVIICLENAELYERTSDRLEEKVVRLQALYDAGQTVTASLDLDIVLNQLVRQAQRLTGKRGKEACFGDILLVDGGKLRFVSAFPEGALDDLRSRFGSRIDLEKGVSGRRGITGRTVRTGESQLVGDVTQDPDFYQACSGQTLSELAVPIKIGGEVTGVINVEHPDYNAFDEDDRRDLESLAAQASIAIQNARQFRLIKGLLKAGEVATAAGELYPALEVIAQSIKETIGCDVVCLYTYDERKREVSYPSVVVGELYKPREQAVWQLVSQEKKLHTDLLGERSVIRKLLEYGSSRFAFCSTKDPILGAGEFAAREGIESSAGILLKVGEEVVGILFANYRSPHHFSREEKQAAELFAYQAAVAIRNAQLYEETVRRATALEVLYEAGKAVTSTLALDEILNRIVEQARRLTGHYGKRARFSDLELVEGNRLKCKAAYPPEHLVGHQRTVGDIDLEHDERIGVIGRAAKTGQSQLVGDVTQDLDYIGYDPETRSELAVPIKLGEEVIGVINVEHPGYSAFDEDDQRALESLAAQAAIAIQNARQFRLREGLLKAGEVVTAAGELYPALEVIAQSIKETIGCDVVCLYTYDERKREVSYPSVVVGELYKPREQAVWQLVSQEKKLHTDLLGERSVIRKLLEYGSSRFAFCSTKDPILGAGEFAAREGIESSAGILLKVGEEVVGILFANYRSPHHFSREEKQAAELFAYQAAVAIRNARQYEETERRLRRQAAVLEATQAIATPLDLAQVLRTIADCAREALDFDAVTLYLYDEAQGTFSSPVMSGVFDQASVLQGPVSPDSAVGRMMRYGKPRFADDVMADPIFAGKFIQREKIKSVAGLPLKVEQKPVGVMFFNSRQPRHFTREDGEALEIFANQAAIAIERGSLFAQTERRATQLHTAAEVARDATSILDVDQLLVTTANLIRDRFDFYHIGVFLVDDDGEYVVVRAGSGETGRQMLEQGYRLKIGEEGIVGYVAGSGEPHIALDIGKDPFHFANPLLPDTRSEMALPLQVRGEMIGVLDVQSVQEAAFTREDVAVLQTLADQLANAIENARLYEQTTQWLSESETLQQVCVSLTETLELHTVLDRVMQAAIQLTGADEGNILFYDRKLGKFTDALTSPGPGQSLRPYQSQVRQRGGHSHTIVQRGQPVVISDTHLDPSVNPVSIAKGRRAAVGVPLPGREGAIGVLWVNWRVPRHLSEQEVSLLVALASQAAVAIENARQYEELKQTKGLVGTMTAVAWMGTVAGAWRHAIGTYTTTIEDLVKLIRSDLSQNLSAGKIEERLVDIEEVTSEIRKVPMPPLSMEAGVESVFINQLIAERIRQLQERKGRYKAVTYESDFALDDAATVRASPEWLRRLLDVLVDNAVDAMADTPIKRLTITTHPADAGVKIAVIDTGRGIPKDVLHKLFLEPVKKPKGAKGSGLGLFLARTVVQTYEGKLDIHSTGPTGTTMVVWLPVEA